MTKTSGATTSYFAWDTAEELPLTLGDGTNSYVYAADNYPVEQISNSGTVTYLHHDQQGSTRLLTNEKGENVGKCSYGAYGAPTCEGSATAPLGYDGDDPVNLSDPSGECTAVGARARTGSVTRNTRRMQEETERSRGESQ